jgi:hypothetical protein
MAAPPLHVKRKWKQQLSAKNLEGDRDGKRSFFLWRKPVASRLAIGPGKWPQAEMGKRSCR